LGSDGTQAGWSVNAERKNYGRAKRQTVLGFKNDSGLMEDGKECEDEMKCARPGT
jgi:hypothetical protein